MSRILRFFAFVFGVFCVGNVLAAGYSCPTYKQYTSCAVGYYMTSNASSTTYNGTPAVGNACRPCSVMGQYNNIDKYTCPGGTAAPVKKTVKVTYVLNGGSGTTPAATTCNFGEACSLNPGTGTSYRRAGYRLVGWSTASSATSGAFSMVLTANTTVYAVWTRCAQGTYKTASATPASACATMSYGYHGTGCDSSYMACTGQAQCTGTTFCEQHIKQECPDPNSEENRREIFPEEYSGSQMVGGKVISANGRGAITECMALVWYDPDPNVTDGQTVGLHEYVFVEGDTKRYQGEVSSWLYDAVGPGYYLTDESGCDEGYASYKSVDICPVGAACPGKERVECDSSNEATVLTETFGLEICTDGNTTSSTGSIKCDSACSNVIGAATWTTPTWSPSTRQVLDKCAINTCSTGYTRSGSASSTAPASYTCSANCNKVTLNGIKNGGSGTTTLYKKTGLATWYSDNACSDVVTKLSPLPTKPNASYAGHYNTSAASGGTQCVAANGTFKTAAACNVSGNTTFYAQYKCDSNYLGSGTRIAGACTGTVRTIYLKSYDGSATHSTIYQKYATGWYSNSAATNEISEVDIPSRDGYTFRGFYTSKQTDLTASGGTGTRRITANGTLPANTTFTSNANLFAAWAHNCIQPSNGTCTLTISDTGTVTYTTKCNAGYYISGAGTYNPTCTPCGDGTYSAGGTATSCTTCPGEYTHSDGTRAASGNCYLTTVAGKYVATANANQITCDNTTAYYYPGGTKVYYGGTGGNVPLIKGEWNAVNTGGTCASKAYCPAGTWGSVAGTCDSIPAGSYPGVASGCATKDDAGDYIGCSGYEACSSLSGVSVSGGTYTSAAGSKNSKACKYTAPNKTITGCSTVTTNTVTYTGTAWPATTYGVTATGGYVISGNNTAAATCTQCSGAVWSAGGTATSCSACPAQTSGWTRNSGTGWTAVTQCNQTKTGTAISSYCASGVLKQNATSATAWGETTIATALSAKAGSIVNGQTCEQCSGAVWSAGGTATSCSACPAQTSGWTRNSGTGWTAVPQCNQTKSVGGNCSAGVLKQNATSTTAWGASTIATALQAKPGYIVSGQTCTGCAAGTYSAGGAATSCSACTGRTHYSAAHASSCSTVSTGYYTTGCNTSNNNCTGQSQCTSGTWCSSGVQHQCSSLTGVSVSGGTYTSAAGSSANTSCKYTAPNKTITGCSTVTTNTVTYTGTAWPATTYGVTATGGYVISGNNTAAATCTQCGTAKYSAGGTATSCSACPTADSGWTATSPAGSSAYTACYEYQTPVNCASGTVKRAASSATAYSSTISLLSTLKSKAGYYASTTATSCTICPAGSSCAASATAPTTCVNWTYAASAGMASCKACPVLTSGWTKANSTGTGWSSHTNCVQISPTPAGCASGNNKQVAASNGATTWGPATVNTELSAKAGHIVSGTTCPICTGATYSAGGTATSCTTCPSIYTSDNTNGKTKNSECKVTTNAGKYIATAGDNTQTSCPAKHYCPSASVAYGATNSPTACPAADSTTERTTYPADYLNVTWKEFFVQSWPLGLKAITDCKTTYNFTNEAGSFTVESVAYSTTTGKYEVGGSKYYGSLKPGWYFTERYNASYCNTPSRRMLYKSVAECPANSYCPGYSSMPLCSTGTYEDEMGKFACSSLGTGAYTKSPAKSGPATACYLTTTATNFVKTAKAAEEKCTAGGYCAGGTKVNWGSTGGRTPASAGYYVSGTGATSQTACAAGTYTDTTGKTTCTSAVAGTHTTGCQVAASGSSTKTLACTGTAVCATNTYSSAKASACTACATAKGYTNSGTTAAAHAELASCKATCSGGQYVATAGAGCVNVGTGYYGAGGTVGQNATLARNQCPTGQTTIGYGAGADEIGDCGRILHIGDNKVYLRNTKKTTPSLNVKVGDTTYYGNMTSGTSKGKLRVKNGTTTYSVHDDSM